MIGSTYTLSKQRQQDVHFLVMHILQEKSTVYPARTCSGTGFKFR